MPGNDRLAPGHPHVIVKLAAHGEAPLAVIPVGIATAASLKRLERQLWKRLWKRVRPMRREHMVGAVASHLILGPSGDGCSGESVSTCGGRGEGAPW